MVKVHPDGSLHRLKVRLVAKSYSHSYGVDYYEIFSHVAKIASVQIYIALAARRH
jgi:hypothetical protein